MRSIVLIAAAAAALVGSAAATAATVSTTAMNASEPLASGDAVDVGVDATTAASGATGETGGTGLTTGASGDTGGTGLTGASGATGGPGAAEESVGESEEDRVARELGVAIMEKLETHRERMESSEKLMELLNESVDESVEAEQDVALSARGTEEEDEATLRNVEKVQKLISEAQQLHADTFAAVLRSQRPEAEEDLLRALADHEETTRKHLQGARAKYEKLRSTAHGAHTAYLRMVELRHNVTGAIDEARASVVNITQTELNPNATNEEILLRVDSLVNMTHALVLMQEAADGQHLRMRRLRNETEVLMKAMFIPVPDTGLGEEPEEEDPELAHLQRLEQEATFAQQQADLAISKAEALRQAQQAADADVAADVAELGPAAAGPAAAPAFFL